VIVYMGMLKFSRTGIYQAISLRTIWWGVIWKLSYVVYISRDYQASPEGKNAILIEYSNPQISNAASY